MLSHSFSSPIADGTNTQLVRPSDWNSPHVMLQTLSGNVVGTSAVTGSNIILQGGNNITLSGTGQTIVFSGPDVSQYLTTAALSDHSHGNPTLALTNLSGTTASNSAGLTISLSASPGGAGDGGNVLAAGTQTANSTGTVVFQNSNGISFGMSNNSQITASHNGLTQQSTQPVAYSAANGSAAFSTLTFANSNGVSFSSGTQGLFATVKTDYLTTARASNDAIGLNTALTANGVSMTANSSGLSLNFPAFLTTAAQSNHSHGNPTLALTNLNGTTASASNGLTLSLSAAAQSVQPVAASGSNGSFAFSTLSFGALNGLTFYTSNGSIVGSYTDAGAGGGVNFSAGTTSSALAAVTFADSNGIAFGLNTGAGAGQITASYTVPSITQFPSQAHIESNTVGVSSVLMNGSAIHLVGGPNITLSGTGSSVVISAAAAGGAGTVSSTIPHGMYPGSTASQTIGAMGVTSASAFFFPFQIDHAVQFDHMMLGLNLSYQTSSVSGQQTVSFSYGIYSNNASTLSLISSSSFSMGVTNSSVSATVNYPRTTNTSGWGYGTTTGTATAQLQSQFGTAGAKLLELPFSNTMSLGSGQYWVGAIQRVSSSSANIGISIAFQGNAVPGIVNRGNLGDASSAFTTNPLYKQPLQGLGPYTSTGSAGYGGTALPASAFLTGIAHTMTILPCLTFDKSL